MNSKCIALLYVVGTITLHRVLYMLSLSNKKVSVTNLTLCIIAANQRQRMLSITIESWESCASVTVRNGFVGQHAAEQWKS